MSVNKFKVDDVVKCVYSGVYNNLTTGKDNGGSANAQQTHKSPKFKEGDMVYLIGFNYFKPCKLTLSNCEDSPLKLEVVMDNNHYETFTANGCYATKDVEPCIVLATEENRLMLNKLLGVEYEPVKLTGSDLAKKLLKDKPQTCYVSDYSEEYAKSSSGGVLITEYENDRFISKSGVGWKFAVPCNQHGEVLEDE